MNKTPHRGTIKFGASSKISMKRLRRQNIRSPSQAIGARPCPFRILIVQRHRRCSAAKSRPSSFEQRTLVATAKLARHSHVHLRQRTHNVESRPRDALRREVIGRHDVVMEQLVGKVIFVLEPTVSRARSTFEPRPEPGRVCMSFSPTASPLRSTACATSPSGRAHHRASATILGRITIGRGSTIGGNVWVTEDAPPNSFVTQATARNNGARPLRAPSSASSDVPAPRGSR